METQQEQSAHPQNGARKLSRQSSCEYVMVAPAKRCLEGILMYNRWARKPNHPLFLQLPVITSEGMPSVVNCPQLFLSKPSPRIAGSQTSGCSCEGIMCQHTIRIWGLGREGWEFGISKCKLLCIGGINDKVLLYKELYLTSSDKL